MPVLPRSDSTSEFMPMEEKEVEYFFASDASAVIEHTNRVIYLEVSACHMNKFKHPLSNSYQFLCRTTMWLL